MDEIDRLVSEYNQAEQEQHKRLVRLYDLLDAHTGHRSVQFGSAHNWTNCWNRERHDLALKQFVDPLVQPITAVNAGDLSS